jgi:hypothetical protein
MVHDAPRKNPLFFAQFEGKKQCFIPNLPSFVAFGALVVKILHSYLWVENRKEEGGKPAHPAGRDAGPL